jgi:DNA-binding LacI/PurR family transcriptional regulator
VPRAIGALREAGRRVPEDVAVGGFDNSAATMVEPR